MAATVTVDPVAVGPVTVDSDVANSVTATVTATASAATATANGRAADDSFDRDSTAHCDRDHCDADDSFDRDSS
ncbi:MAG: hypothetical protein ABEI99_00805, partial [Halobaculum sp.]